LTFQKVLLGILLCLSYSIFAADTYYTTSDTLNVRGGPGTNNSVTARLSKGSRVTLYENANGWARISPSGSQPMWVSEKYLNRLKPSESENVVNIAAFGLCRDWLLDETSYRFFVEKLRAKEYEVGGKYHLQSNLLVQPLIGDITTIGFDCTVWTDMDNNVGAFVQLEEFAAEAPITEKPADLKMRRLQWGGTACPSVAPWKQGRDRLLKGDYNWDYPPSCVFLKAGTRTYGFLAEEEYKGSEYVKIRLDGGKEYWIEPVNF